MKKLLTLICLVLFSGASAIAKQYVPASVTLSNGTELNGAIDLPNNLKANSIEFKAKSGEITNYNSEDLAAFTLKLDKDYRFEYRSQMYNPKSGRTWKTQWYYVTINGPASMYTEGDRLQYNENKGTLTIKEKTDGTFTYCLRMPGEETLYPLDQDYKNKALVKMYCKMAADRFKDSPQTLALIEKMREENKYSLAELVNNYNQWHKQQASSK